MKKRDTQSVSLFFCLCPCLRRVTSKKEDTLSRVFFFGGDTQI